MSNSIRNTPEFTMDWGNGGPDMDRDTSLLKQQKMNLFFAEKYKLEHATKSKCKKSATKSKRKPCKANQVRKRSTGRCRKKSVTKSKRKPCKANQVRKRSTGRCRKKSVTKSKRKPCKANQVRNKSTGRCRKKSVCKTKRKKSVCETLREKQKKKEKKMKDRIKAEIKKDDDKLKKAEKKEKDKLKKEKEKLKKAAKKEKDKLKKEKDKLKKAEKKKKDKLKKAAKKEKDKLKKEKKKNSLAKKKKKNWIAKKKKSDCTQKKSNEKFNEGWTSDEEDEEYSMSMSPEKNIQHGANRTFDPYYTSDIFTTTGNYTREEMGNLYGKLPENLFISNVEQRTALVIVDFQNDFVKGGTSRQHMCDKDEAGKAGGAKCSMTAAASCIKQIEKSSHIILTKDYHPPDHMSFKVFGPHCLIGSDGANIIEPIRNAILKKKKVKGPEFQVDIGYKGYIADEDSFGGVGYDTTEKYKGFTTNHYEERKKELHTKEYLKNNENVHANLLQKPSSNKLIGGMVCCESDVVDCKNLTKLSPEGQEVPHCDPTQEKVKNLKQYDWKPIIKEASKSKNPIILCGLILDYCVLDTAINLRCMANKMSFSKEDVKIVISLSATRPGRYELPNPNGNGEKIRGLYTSFDALIQKLKHYDINLEEGL